MASRRMFSKRVISSARFMKLTRDAQVLYFHLCMNADDDGAVEGFPVRRAIGVEEDAYANLEGRGFIRVLDRENEVVYITDWAEHNKIRADRIQPSMYRDLIAATVEQPVLIEPKARSDVRGKARDIDVSAGQEPDGQSMDGQGTDSGQQMDGQWTDNGRSVDGPWTDNGRPRIGKDRLGQDRTVQEREGEESKTGASAPSRPHFEKPTVEEITGYCREKGYSHVDAEYFWNYYENVGWKVGRNRMKSWKLAVANWEKRHADFEREKRGSVPASHATIVTRDQSESQKWGLFDD